MCWLERETAAERPKGWSDAPPDIGEHRQVYEPTRSTSAGGGSGPAVAFLSMAVVVCLFALAGYKTYRINADQTEQVQSLPGPEEAEASADLWLQSAHESLDSGDYELAVAQLERAVFFFRAS